MFKLKLTFLNSINVEVKTVTRSVLLGLVLLAVSRKSLALGLTAPPVLNPSAVSTWAPPPSSSSATVPTAVSVAPAAVSPAPVAVSVSPAVVSAVPVMAAPIAANVTPPGLTLEQAEAEGVGQSPVYHQAQHEEYQASWTQLEKFSDGFLPHLSVNGLHYLDNQYSYTNIQLGAPPATPFLNVLPNTVLNLDASFVLFDGFKNLRELDSANNNHRAAQYLSDWALFQLQQKIRLQFYQAIAARKLADMADQNVKTLQEHLRIVSVLLQNGHATKYDILRVKVQLDESLSDQRSARDKVVLMRENLTQIMGSKLDERPLTGELPVLDTDAILQKVTGADFYQRQDLRAKELQARAAEDKSEASHAGMWFPEVKLVGEYQWYNTPDEIGSSVLNNDNFRTDYYVGASASWDLFDGLSTIAKVNEDGEKAKAARDEFEAAQVKAPYDFDLWKRRLVSSVLNYQAKLTDVQEAKESARLATVGYEAGSLTTTDVLDAELEEYRAAESLVQSQIDSLEGLVNLELSMGKTI